MRIWPVECEVFLFKPRTSSFWLSAAMIATCQICGETAFIRGPGGRLSPEGRLPQCRRCGSLERHRLMRAFYDKLRGAVDLSRFSCLQFSQDDAIDKNWFRSYYLSIYDTDTSIDLQDIPLSDGAVDCVICNHVLEHVADDNRAIRELFRVISDRGFVQLAVPDPRVVRRRRIGAMRGNTNGDIIGSMGETFAISCSLLLMAAC